MVTASHNENGWTGVKMGAKRPLTFGPDEIGRLKDIALGGLGKPRAGGSYTRVENMRETYLSAVTKGHNLSRPIRVVAACGNGTAGAFAPEALKRHRIREQAAVSLPGRKSPAWVYLHGLKSPLSSTALRALRKGTAKA